MTNANNSIKKGNTVWYTISSRKGLFEGKITSAGHKYIMIDERYRFHASDFREATSYGGASGRIYTSENEYYSKLKLNAELRENINKIKHAINEYNSNLTLEQTRKILEIMYPNSKKN